MGEFPWHRWLVAALLIDGIVVGISLAFPGSPEITYFRFCERQWITLVSLLKLTVASTLAFSWFVVSRQLGRMRTSAAAAVFAAGLLFLALDEWFFVRERLALRLCPGEGLEKASAVLYVVVGLAVLVLLRHHLLSSPPAYCLILGAGSLFAMKVVVGLVNVQLGRPVAYIVGGIFKLAAETCLVIAFLTLLVAAATGGAETDADS